MQRQNQPAQTICSAGPVCAGAVGAGPGSGYGGAGKSRFPFSFVA